MQSTNAARPRRDSRTNGPKAKKSNGGSNGGAPAMLVLPTLLHVPGVLVERVKAGVAAALFPSPPKRKLGRPKGSKDKKPRKRRTKAEILADRERVALGSVAKPKPRKRRGRSAEVVSERATGTSTYAGLA